jgi:phage terminase small subunit
MPVGEVGKYGIGTTNPSEIWDELVSICPPHVLKNSDRLVMEIAVEYLRQFRESPASYSNERVRILISLLGKFGMTPSDRAKLSIPEVNNPDDEDPWAKLARQYT